MTEVWSCGGGRQSAAIAALIYTGQIDPPDVAVIADTGRERSSTWAYWEFLNKLIPIERVYAKDFATVDLWGGKDKRTLLIPAFTSVGGTAGKMSGFCSGEWKTRVVDRWLKSQGIKDYRRWLGFSTDELERAKDFSARFPLIEQRMSANDCISFVESLGWPSPPRSSCWMCPNHGLDEWRDIQRSEDWQKVVEFDREIRKTDPDVWLTREMIPMDQADFTDPNLDLFRDSGCESGVCFT